MVLESLEKNLSLGNRRRWNETYTNIQKEKKRKIFTTEDKQGQIGFYMEQTQKQGVKVTSLESSRYFFRGVDLPYMDIVLKRK